MQENLEKIKLIKIKYEIAALYLRVRSLLTMVFLCYSAERQKQSRIKISCQNLFSVSSLPMVGK